MEAGAADCEFSETLPLEKHYNWTGVLIEAVPSYFQECKEVGVRHLKIAGPGRFGGVTGFFVFSK